MTETVNKKEIDEQIDFVESEIKTTNVKITEIKTYLKELRSYVETCKVAKSKLEDLKTMIVKGEGK